MLLVAAASPTAAVGCHTKTTTIMMKSIMMKSMMKTSKVVKRFFLKRVLLTSMIKSMMKTSKIEKKIFLKRVLLGEEEEEEEEDDDDDDDDDDDEEEEHRRRRHRHHHHVAQVLTVNRAKTVDMLPETHHLVPVRVRLDLTAPIVKTTSMTVRRLHVNTGVLVSMA